MKQQIEKIKKQFKKLEKDLQDPAIVSDAKKLKIVSTEHADLKDLMDIIEKYEQHQNIKSNDGVNSCFFFGRAGSNKRIYSNHDVENMCDDVSKWM